MRVGINGFGRIGRAITKINLKKKAFDLMAVNDINPDINNVRYLLKYDSTYGRLEYPVRLEGANLIANDGPPIAVYSNKDIDKVPWEKHNVDVIIDSSGIEKNMFIFPQLADRGVRHCIITNSPNGKYTYRSVIMGVNEHLLSQDDYIISSSICDANAIVPILNLLQENFGVEHGFITTLHPWLSYQNLLDGPSLSFSDPGSIHSTFALGRSSFNTMIPKSTTCIGASCKILPWIDSKFIALSYRVPTTIVTSADISVKLSQKTSSEELIQLFEEAERTQKYTVIQNNDEALTAIDFTGSEYSVIIDHRWTHANRNSYCKFVLWYDNEWGYSCRVVDIISYLKTL